MIPSSHSSFYPFQKQLFKIAILSLVLLGILYSCINYIYNKQNTLELQLKWSQINNGELIIERQCFDKADFESVLFQLENDDESDLAFEAFITIDGNEFKVSKDLNIFKSQLFEDSTNLINTIHLKRKTEDLGWHYTSLSFKEDLPLNFSKTISEQFYPDNVRLCFSQNIFSCNPEQSSPTLKLHAVSPKKDNYLIPHFSSMDQLNVELTKLENSTYEYPFDSLIMIIKDSDDISYKCRGGLDELLVKLEGLESQKKSASIYLLAKNQIQEKHFCIFSFGKEQFLNLENPTLLENTFQIEIENLLCNNYRYTPSTYFFNWGEIALSAKQDKKGNYKAKSTIPYSKWYDAVKQTPNLLINNGDSIVEEFSLQVKFEKHNETTVSGIDFGKFNSNEMSTNSSLANKDTLDNLKDNIIGSTVLLEDFVFFDDLKENITLEIEITEDEVLKQTKRFQFNWKHIDTIITKESEHNDYELCIQMRKKAFLECLDFEPILTSSKDGVIWDYSFDVFRQKSSTQVFLENIACSIKDPKLYKAKQINKILDNINPEDVIVLKNFKAKEIQENLSIFIEIQPDLEEPVETNSNELYVDWGNLKLKATDLSTDKTKKFYSDQVITKEKLLSITESQMYLLKDGKKEVVDKADLIIMNEKEVRSCKKDNAWKYCLAQHISDSKVGDHINIFLRSNSGQSALMQFYIEEADAQSDILGYGIKSDFDTLLIQYAKPVYKKEKSKLTQYHLNWGPKINIPIKKVSNPSNYGGSTTILSREFSNNIGNEFTISNASGELLEIEDAGIMLLTPNFRMQHMVKFDCVDGKCSVNSEDLSSTFEQLNWEEVISTNLMISSIKNDSVEGNYLSFRISIENPEGPWIPKQRLKYLSDLTQTFEFQFVYNFKGKSILKLDLENPEYHWMVDKYKSDPNVQIKNFPNFKTIERTVDQASEIVKKEKVKRVEVLSERFESIHEFPDFHDFKNKRPQLLWKSYLATQKTDTYCLEDFICSEGELELTLNEKQLKIYRAEMMIVTPNGEAMKYVFDNIDDFEIEKRLKTISEKSSIYFTNILIDTESEGIQRMPISFAFHLE